MSEGSGSQRYCGNCGAEIRSGTSFCVSCGAELVQEPARTNPAHSVPPPPSSATSFADTLRERIQGLTERISNARSTSAGGTLRGSSDRAINWFKNLSSVPKLVLVGLFVLLVIILISPVAYFVGLTLILVGIVAVVINLIRRKPFKKWVVIGTGVAAAFTLIIGIVSNLTYNTNYVWGIGYELTAREKGYLHAVDRQQEIMLRSINGQATVMESYPDITEQEIQGFIEGPVMDAVFAEDNTKYIPVPSGCEEHYKVWTQAMKEFRYSTYSASDFMTAGNAEDEDFARFHRREGMGYLDEANRIYNRIERQGCGG